MDQCEDGRVRPDAESESDGHDKREPRGVAQLAQRVTKIVNEPVHPFISLKDGYSARSACMGSTDAVRRAGKNDAATASPRMENAASTITTGSSGSTWKSSERKRRVAKKAPTAPRAEPASPVDAQQSQQHRRRGKAGDKRRIEAGRRLGFAHSVFHRLHLGERKLRINGAHHRAQ